MDDSWKRMMDEVAKATVRLTDASKAQDVAIKALLTEVSGSSEIAQLRLSATIRDAMENAHPQHEQGMKSHLAGFLVATLE